ncbi:site-specific integrase [Paraburkholderia nemoris]|uniref:tyrosine-type recombinase/integrase n=1 Tax=Paraburkholderia nemoris TaxID=2793076 RepID=UPI0038B7235E
MRRRAELAAARAFEDAERLARGLQPIPTLRELLQQWIETHRPIVSASHIKGMDELLRLHLYGLGALRIDRITTADIEDSRNQHLQAHAPATANHWVRRLRLAFKWAVRRKVIPEVPWALKEIKIQSRPRAILPAAKASQWLAAVDAQGRTAIARAIRLMIGLGLRENETRTARWEWIDWERQTYTPGKTKGREAVPVPMHGWLVDYLRPLREPAGPIVVNKYGNEYSAGFTSRTIKAANAATGIEGITPHRLRGTFATMLSEAGVPIQTIQKVMRHKSPLTTMKYLELDLEQAVRGQNQIAQKLGFNRQSSGGESGEA